MLSINLVCDALATACIGCYGCEWVRTLAIDRLAHQGIVFDHCFSSLGVTPGGWRRTGFDLPLHARRARGISSVWLSDRTWSSSPPQGAILPHRKGNSQHSLRRLLQSSLDWLDQNPGQDAILWLEIGMIEAGWEPSADRLADTLEGGEPVDLNGSLSGSVDDLFSEEKLDAYRDTYAARVQELDSCFGEFFSGLEERGLYETSLICVTADEGWPLGEHGVVGKGQPWIHEERDHVPLIIKYPGGRTAARSPSLTTTADLGATIDSCFGLDAAPGGLGVSLAPLIMGEFVKTRDMIVSSLNQETAVRTQGWKLILPANPTAERPRQLYAKPDDRWEFNDRCVYEPDIADHLELELRRFMEQLAAGTPENTPPLRMDILRRK